jgi:hypothetical protein
VSAALAEVPEPGTVVRCGCCQDCYIEDNDLALFGMLKDANGVMWALCGPCIQIMWRERAPQFDAPQLM